MPIGRHAGGPKIGHCFFDRRHPWQTWCRVTGDDARKSSRARLHGGSHGPHRFASVEPEAFGEHPSGGHRFELWKLQRRDAAHQVLGIAKLATLLALGLDLVGQVGTNTAYRSQPETNGDSAD